MDSEAALELAAAMQALADAINALPRNSGMYNGGIVVTHQHHGFASEQAANRHSNAAFYNGLGGRNGT